MAREAHIAVQFDFRGRAEAHCGQRMAQFVDEQGDGPDQDNDQCAFECAPT